MKITVLRDKRIEDVFRIYETTVVGRSDLKFDDPTADTVDETNPVLLNYSKFGRRIVFPNRIAIPAAWFSISFGSKYKFHIHNLTSDTPVQILNSETVVPGEIRGFNDQAIINIGDNLQLRIDAARVSLYLNERQSSSSLSATHLDEALNIEVNAGELLQLDGSYSSLSNEAPLPLSDMPIPHIKSIGRFPASDASEIAKMLRLALQVVNSRDVSDTYYGEALAVISNIVGLDRAVLLLKNEVSKSIKTRDIRESPDGWRIASERCSFYSETVFKTSKTLLKRVLELKRTVVHDPTSDDAFDTIETKSLDDVVFALASPILNREGMVIGVLYGERRSGVGAVFRSVEATLVEIIAGAIANTIAIRAEEKTRSVLSGFFSPKISESLLADPALMDGRDTEVSVLFCDIRGFSSVTEILGPQMTITWINETFTLLSQAILDLDGVLIDYVGDELFAMFGSPGEQMDHGFRAIQAATAMQASLDILRSRWSDVLPIQFSVGIGINTGQARVGNVGSKQKFKYGPLGNSVNTGSRLQGATKQFEVPCIASSSTVLSAGCADQCRRLGKIKVIGIDLPIDVYEVPSKANERFRELATNYQYALADFEECRLFEAAKILGTLLSQFPEDRPCRKLLSRVVKAIDEPAASFCPIWQLTSK